LNNDFSKYTTKPKKNSGNSIYTDPSKEERLKRQKEYLQQRIENDGMEVNQYDSYQLLQDGRYDETPALSFKESFTLKKMINKAGRNYLLDFGKLIGGQIKLEED